MRLTALLLTVLLTACSQQEQRDALELGATERDALRERIAQLESRIEVLEVQLQDLASGSPDPTRIAQIAGARTCVTDLSRLLEAFRTDNERYPRPSEVELPGACADLRVEWRELTTDTYEFAVLAGEQVLTTKTSQ